MTAVDERIVGMFWTPQTFGLPKRAGRPAIIFAATFVGCSSLCSRRTRLRRHSDRAPFAGCRIAFKRCNSGRYKAVHTSGVCARSVDLGTRGMYASGADALDAARSSSDADRSNVPPRNRAASRIEAPVAGAEGDKLQKATSHGDILQKIDHLVRVGEIGVGHKCRGNAPHRQGGPRQARLIPD
jgi:hypothetical protein